MTRLDNRFEPSDYSNSIGMKFCVAKSYPDEYKQHAYQNAKREFAIALYEALEKLQLPVTVDLSEQEYTDFDASLFSGEVTNGIIFRAKFFRVFHEHVVVQKFEPPMSWYLPQRKGVIEWIKNLFSGN